MMLGGNAVADGSRAESSLDKTALSNRAAPIAVNPPLPASCSLSWGEGGDAPCRLHTRLFRLLAPTQWILPTPHRHDCCRLALLDCRSPLHVVFL